MRKPMAGFLLHLVLGSGVAPADTPQRKTALLLEAHGMPEYAGLDAPRRPMPDGADFCFQVDDHFYVARIVCWEYRGQQEVSHC